jgi:hypothetical protein
MPKKMEVDNKKLVEMVKSGSNTKEIMESFGFKTSTQAKVAYLNAAMEQGILPEIKSGRGSSKESKPNEISVSKRGSLVIPKQTIAEFGFKEGDSFEMKRTKSGISLKQIVSEEPPKKVTKKKK